MKKVRLLSFALAFVMVCLLSVANVSAAKSEYSDSNNGVIFGVEEGEGGGLLPENETTPTKTESTSNSGAVSPTEVPKSTVADGGADTGSDNGDDDSNYVTVEGEDGTKYTIPKDDSQMNISGGAGTAPESTATTAESATEPTALVTNETESADDGETTDYVLVCAVVIAVFAVIAAVVFAWLKSKNVKKNSK